MNQIYKIYHKFLNIPINTFLPISKYLIFWYFFSTLIITFSFVVSIIVICFRNQTAKIILYQVLNYIILIVLFIDFIISFNIGFVKQGKLIMDRQLIILNYLKNIYFWVDILAVIISVLQIILLQIFQYQFPFLTLLVYIKIIKTIAFDTLIKRYWIKSTYTLLFYQLLKNFLLLTLLCHIFGSLFFYVDLKLIQDGYQGDQLWVINSYCYGNILYQQFWVQYTYSFYFIVVTLSGVAYGDLVPLNNIQILYAFGCVAFPILIFAYLFSVIYQVIQDRRANNARIFRIKLLAKNRFKNLQLNSQLSQKLLNYIDYYYQNTISSQDSFIQDLAPSIRSKYRYNKIKQKIDLKLFQKLNFPQLIFYISNIVHQQAFPQRYNLILNLKLLYINQGSIAIYLKMSKRYTKIILKNNYVGTYSFFTSLLNPNIKLQTQQFILTQTIKYQQFRQLIKNSQHQLNQDYCILKQNISIYNQLNLINYQCFFCNGSNHDVSNCYHLRGKFKYQDFYGNYYWNLRKYQNRRKIKSIKIYQPKNNIFNQNGSNKRDNSTQTSQQTPKKEQNPIQSIRTWSKYHPKQNI